jgi:hypothetical protein
MPLRALTAHAHELSPGVRPRQREDDDVLGHAQDLERQAPHAEPRLDDEREDAREQQDRRLREDRGDVRARRRGQKGLAQDEGGQQRQRGPSAVVVKGLEPVAAGAARAVARRPHHGGENDQRGEPERAARSVATRRPGREGHRANHAVAAVAIARCSCPRW